MVPRKRRDTAYGQRSFALTLTAVQWLINHKVKWIPKLHWMANISDLAPMDYAINANFKRILKKSRARTATEVARLIQKEGKKTGVEICRNALLRWKFCVKIILEKQESHIE